MVILFFLSWVVGPYIISRIMSHIMIIGYLQHEKGIKNSTVYCSYFCNAKLPNIRRHEKVYLLLRKCSTLVLEFECCFRKTFNWVLNFISVIIIFTFH